MGSLHDCGTLSIASRTHTHICTHTDNTLLLFHLITLLFSFFFSISSFYYCHNYCYLSIDFLFRFTQSPCIPAWLSICPSGCHMIIQELQEAPGRMVETRCISGGIDHGFISWLAYGSTLSPLMRIKVLQLQLLLQLLLFLSFLRLSFTFPPFLYVLTLSIYPSFLPCYLSIHLDFEVIYHLMYLLVCLFFFVALLIFLLLNCFLLLLLLLFLLA